MTEIGIILACLGGSYGARKGLLCQNVAQRSWMKAGLYFGALCVRDAEGAPQGGTPPKNKSERMAGYYALQPLVRAVCYRFAGGEEC